MEPTVDAIPTLLRPDRGTVLCQYDGSPNGMAPKGDPLIAALYIALGRVYQGLAAGVSA